MPQLTLGWLTLINARTADVIPAAAAAGFESVSVRITARKPADSYDSIVANPAAIRNLKSSLAANGVRLSNTSIYHLYPDVTMDHVLPAIEASAELGAKIMVATCMDPEHDRWVAFMARYCEAAKQSGITVALEFVPYSEARTAAVGEDLVKRTGADNFGLLVDSLHLSRSGGVPADIAKLDPKHIVFAQICDATAMRPPFEGLTNEARTGRLYPGDGALPLYDFLDALPDGLEIEVETPLVAVGERSAIEQAKLAGDATRTYLDAYCAARRKPQWR